MGPSGSSKTTKHTAAARQPTTTPLALGLDIGGTATRALVIDVHGTRHGAGRGHGANLTSHSLDAALDSISAALAEALRGIDSARVGAAVIATAGVGHLTRPEVIRSFTSRWRGAGLRSDYDLCSDAVAAFVAGTAEPAGTLVLSGTGALAARAEDRQLVHIAGGHGWLLGDQGSGFWIGREAVRTTLAALDQRKVPGALGQAVISALLGPVEPGRDPRKVTDDMVRTVHREPPVALAALAPLVTRQAAHDPVAGQIIERSAEHLIRTVETVRLPTERTPFVFAGSLLNTDTPLARLMRQRLAARWPDALVKAATDGAAGAAWLAAIRMAGLSEAEAEDVHRRLFAAA